METTQIKRVFNALTSRNWLTLRDLHIMTGDPEGSISSQMRNLRMKKHGSHVISKRVKGVKNDNLWEYKIEGSA
jgi:hypothetical protein